MPPDTLTLVQMRQPSYGAQFEMRIGSGPITTGWDVFVPYGTGTYVGSQGFQANGNTIGTGNPSSVILNGMSFNGAQYVDNTPGDLTDNPNNPAFATLYAGQLGCGAVGGVGGCTNNQAIGQYFPTELQTLLNARQDPNAPESCAEQNVPLWGNHFVYAYSGVVKQFNVSTLKWEAGGIPLPDPGGLEGYKALVVGSDLFVLGYRRTGKQVEIYKYVLP